MHLNVHELVVLGEVLVLLFGDCGDGVCYELSVLHKPNEVHSRLRSGC